MKYYKFIAETPYAGTSNDYYESFENEPTEEELDEMACDFAAENGESFEYLVFGWNADPVVEGEMTQEEYEQEIEFYREDCTCSWEEISESEFKENTQ